MTARMAALGVVVLLLGACEPRGGFHGIEMDPPKDVKGFAFTRANGATMRTDAEKGRPQLIFFGYTHCPDVCPTTLADWKKLKASIGQDASRVRFIMVTVDPVRDSAAVVERYVAQFDPDFVGLSGDSATTASMQASFGVASYEEPGTPQMSGHAMSHSSQVFLVDGKGRIVAHYPFGIGWEAMAADLKRFL